jgi:D-aminopeptidase
VLAAGDSAFVAQFTRNVAAEAVLTKTAVTPQSARLRHPTSVKRDLETAVNRALDRLPDASPWRVGAPVRVRLQFADPTRPQILAGMPGVTQVDGYTVEFEAPTMAAAYRLIRIMYRFIAV